MMAFLVVWCSIMIVEITREFRELVERNQQVASTAPQNRLSPHVKMYHSYGDDIQANLLKIEHALTANRENYFANASYSFEAFTDRQRTELNQQVRSNLQVVSQQINQLNEGLKTQTRLHSKTQQEHMKAIIICVFQLLKRVEKLFRKFQDFSQKRLRKIEETIELDKQSEKKRIKMPEVTRKSYEPADEELAKEAGLFYVQKVREQREIQETKEKLENLNDMMASMSNVVWQQELQTAGFLTIGEEGLFHIEKGNRNLVEATALAKSTGKWWCIFFLALAGSLLVLDFLNS